MTEERLQGIHSANLDNNVNQFAVDDLINEVRRLKASNAELVAVCEETFAELQESGISGPYEWRLPEAIAKAKGETHGI